MHYIAERFWIGKVSWFRLYIRYVVDYDSIIQRAKLNLKTKLEWLRVVILKFENLKKCQLFDNSKWLIKEVIKFINALCDKYVVLVEFKAFEKKKPKFQGFIWREAPSWVLIATKYGCFQK